MSTSPEPTRKRAPGAGRKPGPDGRLIVVTVRLSAQDIEYLRTVDENVSNAIRKVIASSKPLPSR